MTPYDPPRRNRLYRSRDNRVFFGVCGGIAEHFDFSPNAVRFLYVLLTFFAGFPLWIIAYIGMGLLLKPAPERPFVSSMDEDFYNTFYESRSAALRKVHLRQQALDKRIQRMETIVTSPRFGLEEEYRNL